MFFEARKLISADTRANAVLTIALLFCATTTCRADTPTDTPHIEFVHEFIRELGELESLRTRAAIDLKQKDTNVFMEGIHFSTLTQIALRTHISILGDMHFAPPFDQLVPQIIGYAKMKIGLHDRLIAISTEFISGPKPGADYGKLGAEMPQVRAQMESIDHSFLTMSSLVFAMLISDKPDSAGHMSRLTITKADRQNLLSQLHTAFGAKLDQKDPDDLVNAAWVLRAYLRKDKGFKCSDET
jgi:hypothetical protein